MSSTTLELPKSDTGEAPVVRKPTQVERPKFPLVVKLFLSTALLIVVVVGLAIGVTVQRANSIAHETVNASISSAAKLFREFEAQRLARLRLAAEVATTDRYFGGYLENNLKGEGEAAASTTPGAASTPSAAPDLVSIFDQLKQRKDSFGSDLVILLDDQGRVVVRTDQPAVTTAGGEDLYEQTPLVKAIVDDAAMSSTAGVLVSDGKLYHAAVVPLTGTNTAGRFGFLVNAYSIDDAFANSIATSTNAGVIFAAAKSPTLSRSSNAPSVGMQQMAGMESIFSSGKPVPPSNVTVDRSAYVMTGEPLTNGAKTVGAAVFVRSLDRELMPFRQIEHALFWGGGLALLLAFIVSWFMAKAITRPIEDLARVAQSVTAGDYAVRPPMNQTDEVGILGRSFAKMITALRDKAELEDLYQQMAARSKAREAVGAPQVFAEPASEEGTILVTDLRGFSAEGDPATVIAAMTKAMRIQEAEVARQEGSVREVEGHRLVSVFPGERGAIHAIRAARAINEELGTQHGGGLSVGAGIAAGQFVTGTLKAGEESSSAILGNAPLLALLYAWHAPAGVAFMTTDVAQAAGPEVSASTVRDEVRLKWVPQPLVVAALPMATMGTGVIRSIGAGSLATMRIDSPEGAEVLPVGRDLSPGEMFAGRYLVEQVIGRGGMGVVYRAADTQLEETVAIKTLPGDMMQRSAENLERFKREIRLARKITHRNVLRTYDYGEADGVVFISMEYVRGYTLAELLTEADDHRMPPRVAVGVARQISRGLEAAHDQGIIHRDIKPQNVLIDHKGEVKLMDFGIARMAESNEGMTQAGLIIGTPHYMSPEQVQGKTLDPRSDVYSMGVMLYELLVGKRPFESPSLTAILAAQISEKPRPVVEIRPDVGRELNAIVMRCLEKDPAARFTNAGALLRELDHVSTQQLAVA